MGWAGQVWGQINQETNYGVYNGAGSVLYPVFYGANGFTVRGKRLRTAIRTADSGNRRKQNVASRTEFTGTMSTQLYPSQAAYWANMLTLGTDSTNAITVPSYSFAYWTSVKALRFLGGKASKITITSAAEQDEVVMTVDWIFQNIDPTFTSFAQPLESVYPTETPYTHVETSSNCTLGGTAFSSYKSLTITIQNMLKPAWNELPYISALYYAGRDLNFQFGPEYLASTYRSDYDNQAALQFVLEWVRITGSHNLTFACNSNSYSSSIDDELPLDGVGYQTVGVECFFDSTPGSDFSVTAA